MGIEENLSKSMILFSPKENFVVEFSLKENIFFTLTRTSLLVSEQGSDENEQEWASRAFPWLKDNFSQLKLV